MNITLIAAVDENRCIGYQGRLPWNIGSDLRRFKQRTIGRTVVMGRKTFDSIGRPLPQRRNIIMTRDKNWNVSGVEVAYSPEEIISMCPHDEEVIVIGGGEIYTLFMELCSRIELSIIDTRIEQADAYFPEINETGWEILSTGELIQEKEDEYAYRIVIYQRRGIIPADD